MPALMRDHHDLLVNKEREDLDVTDLQFYLYNHDLGAPLAIQYQLHGKQ